MPKYADLHKIVKKMGKKAFIPICKKRAIRDYGMTANAFGSFMTMIGLETLSLRVERVNKSVAKIAAILEEKLPEGVMCKSPITAFESRQCTLQVRLSRWLWTTA